MNPYELRKRFQNFASVGKPWYKITNLAEGPTQITIYDAIGGFGVSADAFVTDLNKIAGPVELRISSEGGEVFQAKAIYNALASRADLTVFIEGLAASAASFIAMAASPGKLFMSAVSSLMIHDGHTIAMGNATDIRALADILDRESNTIAGIYSQRTGKTVEYMRDKMRAETWYNAAEAMAEGLIDGIIDPRSGALMNSVVKDAAHHGYVSPHDTHHEPMTGHHSHNHASFGHEDGDDGIHAHGHVHQDDADHDHGHMTHSHSHGHDGHEHRHAHDAGDDSSWGEDHDHPHTHHAGYDPDHDGDDDSSRSGDTDHDYAGRVDDSVGGVGVAKILAMFGQEYLDQFPESPFYDRTFTTEERQRLAKTGAARSNGGYPIETCKDALNARRAYGRAAQGERGSVASHIRSREKALGGCGRETFSPGGGADDSSLLVITDEEAASYAANLKL